MFYQRSAGPCKDVNSNLVLFFSFQGMWGGRGLAIDAQVDTRVVNPENCLTINRGCYIHPAFPPNLDPVTQSYPSSDKDCQDDLGMKNGILRKRFIRELAVLRRNADYRCVPYLDGF